METALPDTSTLPSGTFPSGAPPGPVAAASASASGGAAATLLSIERKIVAGEEPAKPDWESFQIGLLQMNMKIANDEKSSARVKADAVGKMLWATQMNLDRYHSDEKMREEYAQRDRLEENRLDRRMDMEQVMKGHRWRTKTKKQTGSIHIHPHGQTFAIPPYEPLHLKWPVRTDEPPVRDEEYDSAAVPRWVWCDLGRPLEADDLPDEVYWFGKRPQRFGERKQEPLFRVVKFRNPHDAETATVYRRTARGKAEFPDLRPTDARADFRLLRDDEISEYEAKAFGEQPPVKR